MHRFVALFLVLFAAINIIAVAAPGMVTTESLLREMTDLSILTNPAPYKAFQFSSYDRNSVAPYAPGWYANSDGFGNESKPNVLEVLEAPKGKDDVGRYLIAEMDGPGAIVRTWTPMPHPMNGKLIMWLDGKKKPVYDGPAATFIRDRQSCWKNGFDPKTPGISQADANYFPIPFAKHLRIEWIGKVSDLHFYHIGVRQYGKGVKVQTFNPDELPSLQSLFEEVSLHLAAPDRWYINHPLGAQIPFECTVNKDETIDLFKETGPGAVVEFAVKVEGSGYTNDWRETVLVARFDDAPAPQIEAPIGDFFGSWPGITPYDSLPMTVRPDGTMICRFVMPFAKSAVIQARNFCGIPLRITGWRITQPGGELFHGQHFCAKWRVDHGLTAGGGNEARDLPFFNATGCGTYVGTSAHVMNPTQIITIGGSWWGEGDEKIWLDDNPFPAFFGTGSEDYFNYSWSRTDLFSHAYCAQPVASGPGCAGYTTNLRWHILDAIPFRTHIAFFMELFHHSHTENLEYARTAYYYAPVETRDDAIHLSKFMLSSGRYQLSAPVAAGPEKPAVFFEAEDCLIPVEKGSNVRTEMGDLWSKQECLIWSPNATEDTLRLKIDVPETGKYVLHVTNRLTPDSGLYQVAIDDGIPMGMTPDLYTPNLVMSRLFGFDEIELEKGPHTIRFISRGPDRSGSGNIVGIDLIWLWPKK